MSGVPSCCAKAIYCSEDKDWPRIMITFLSSHNVRKSEIKLSDRPWLRSNPLIIEPRDGLIELNCIKAPRTHFLNSINNSIHNQCDRDELQDLKFTIHRGYRLTS